MKLNNLKNLITSVLVLFVHSHAYCQDLEVKEMKWSQSDISASTQTRVDSLGIPCGLIKVQVQKESVKFEGNVIGEVDNKMNEYWVYLTKGSKQLVINRDSFLPMKIVFKDYGIEGIDSKTTYVLSLKEKSFNYDKNCLILNVNPVNAKVRIDNNTLKKQDKGFYKLYIDKGEHVIRVDANGYQSHIQTITTGKKAKTIDISLESMMANVNLDIENNNANIYANGELISKGSWNGQLPAGKYTFEASLEGYKTIIQVVTLSEKETKSIHLPALERDIISLYIVIEPKDGYQKHFYIDGIEYNLDESSLIGVPSGNHAFKLETYGCKTEEFDSNVLKSDTLRIKLEPSSDIYRKAYSGDIDAMFKIIRSLSYDEKEIKDYWYRKILYMDESSIKIWSNGKSVSDVFNSFGNFYNNDLLFDKDALKKQVDLLIIVYNNIERYQDSFEETVIANLFLEIGEYDNAITWYNKYENKNKSQFNVISPVIWNDIYTKIGKSYLGLENYNQAVSYLKKAYNLYKDSPTVEALGDTYRTMGDMENAVLWYRELLEKHYKNSYKLKPFLQSMKEYNLYDSVIKGILDN